MSPPWTLFDMALLTLLTLLAAAVAREDAHSCSRDQQPKISSNNLMVYVHDEHYSVRTSYGKDVILFCSSDNASNLVIRNQEDQQLPATCLNSTTIQVSLMKPDLGKYVYSCTDSNTSCTVTLEVFVSPAMSVRASRALQSDDRCLVPHGEPYDILCSAHTVDLHIKVLQWSVEEKLVNKLVNNIVINETTVMAKIMNDTEGLQYTCNWREYSKTIYVHRGYFPEATKFRCFLYLEAKANVECSWESLNVHNNFELFVLHGERSTLLCRETSVNITRRCEGPLHDDSIRFIETTQRISLQVETCFKVHFCHSQIFHKNTFSILKLPPISDLTLINTSWQGATVAWSLPTVVYAIVYKVEYRLLGTDWRSVNASGVRCENHTPTCELQLALPCPDAQYELRVYARTRETTDDMYWSNPATFFFFTAPGMGGEVDPACGAVFTEVEKPPPSALDAHYEFGKLKRDILKEENALRKRIRDMYKNFYEIKALMQTKEKNP